MNSARSSIALFVAWLAFGVIQYLSYTAAADIRFSDDLQRTFESRSPIYERYSQMTERYGSSDTDIYVVFQASSFADPAAQEVVSDFIIDAQFVDYVTFAVSPFSFTVTETDGSKSLLLPWDKADAADRLRNARNGQPALKWVLSEDLKTALVILLLPNLPGDAQSRAAVVEELHVLLSQATAGTQVSAALTGFPVFRDAAIKRLDADFIVLNLVGLVAGTLIATVALGSVIFGAIVAITAQSARLWTVAVLTGFGFDINAVTVTLPTLILVLVFAQAVHLSVEAKRLFADGAPNPLRRTFKVVMPAAFLAALTTGVAFAGLMVTPSKLVFQLGAYGAAAILFAAFVAALIFALFLTTADRLYGIKRITDRSWGNLIDRMSFGETFRFAIRHQSLVTGAGLVAILVSTAFYLRIDPNYSLFESVEAENQTLQALLHVEDHLGPINGLIFEHPAAPQQKLEAARDALNNLSAHGPVLGAGSAISDLPEPLHQRMVSPDGQSVLLTLPYQYSGSAKARNDISALKLQIANDPELTELGPMTGRVHLTAFVSQEILGAFSRGFLLATLAAGIVVAVWLRSPLLGVIAVLPNVLPITLVGAWMWLAGWSFSFTSGIALTIAFGIAVDDTVHALNRIKLVARRDGRLSEETIATAMSEVSPALVLSSLILIAGIFGTLLSDVPGLQIFGILCIAVFVLALISVIVLLPAILSTVLRHFGERAIGL